MTPTIRVPKWSEFQHYKNRNPPWIKLHRQLLTKRAWRELDPFAAKLLVEIWLAASETNDGNLELSTADLAWHLRYPETDAPAIAKALLDLASEGLLELCDHDASAVLAECEQHACPEGEERERERESSVSEETGETPNRKTPEKQTAPEAPARDPEADFEARRSEIAGAIREHAWLGMDPPRWRELRRWHMGRELSIAKELLKQYPPDALLGGIEMYREAHELEAGRQWSLAWVYGEGDRWRMEHAIKRWREKAIDEAEVPAFRPRLVSDAA